MKTVVLSLLIVFASISGHAQAKADDVLGVWTTGSKKGRVEIYKQGGKYYGKIIWLKEPLNDEGQPKKDVNNEDSDLQSRPLMGLVNLNGFEFDADDEEWVDGTIYDPENGKTYDCYLWFEEDSPNNLQVRGFIGFSLIGRTDVWTRYQ